MTRLAIALLVLASVTASAQSARPGMRLTVTRVAPTGGFTASGLLIVHATTIVRTPAPECGANAVRIEVRGRDARGPIRAAHLVTIASADDRATEIGSGACAASLEVVLEDGTTVGITRGTVHGHLVDGSGLDVALEGSVIDAEGVPTTVTGHIVLSPAF